MVESPVDDKTLAILLIEDNPGDARLIALLLDEAAGNTPVRLTQADRLSSALALLVAPPDAVLLDLSLPDSHGLATFVALHAAAPGIPIVVLSGVVDETVALEAVAAGAQDYLVKGRVDGDGILRALRYAIERQRTAAERQRLLAESERLTAERTAILGQIADGVLLANPSGCITFVNAAARRLYATAGIALAVGQSIGAHGLRTANDEPYPVADLPLARALARGETVLAAEWGLRRTDGATIAIQGSATPVRGEGGVALGAVLTFRDVTAARALARRKEEFFANASHDLRTPLAAIKASIGVVKENLPAEFPPPLRRMVTNIDHATTGMAQLVDDLLELARLEGQQSRPPLVRVDLRAIVERAARAVEPLVVARHQQLRAALPDTAMYALVDAVGMERALLNLLGNAQKYGREGGRINLSLEAAGSEVILSVTDDGPGIPPEDQPRIFERFYRPTTTATREFVGSGLGLPIVRATAEQHGGRVWVESTPGHGATFRIALPTETPDGVRGAHTLTEQGE